MFDGNAFSYIVVTVESIFLDVLDKSIILKTGCYTSVINCCYVCYVLI